MPYYRRAKITGGTYFFTVVTYQRQKLLTCDPNIGLLKETIREVKRQHPFAIDAWVILPDHMHCIWTMPNNDADFSKRIGLIKAGFTRRVKGTLQRPDWLTESKRKHRESTIWQRRFWEHKIRNDMEKQHYVDYVHFNPVKHGLVQTVVDWPHSTFQRYVTAGIYPRSWAGTGDFNGTYGE